MKKLYIALGSLMGIMLIAVIAKAAILGAPFQPEVDTRFNTLETQMGAAYSANGLHAKQIAVATYDFSAVGGSSTVNSGVYDLGVTIPAKATITRSWLKVLTQLVGSSNTIAFKCESANNIKTATDITGSGVGTLIEGESTGAISAAKAITNACNISAVLAVNNLSAGKVTAFVEYVVSP